jgi:hypothetical protein
VNSLFIRDRLPGSKPLRFHYIPLFGAADTATVAGVAGTAGGTDVPTPVPATSAPGDREAINGDGVDGDRCSAGERARRGYTIAELPE